MDTLDFFSCAQVVRLLDDFVDRELTLREIRQVERHLLVCGQCAREVRLEQGTLRSIWATLRRIRIPPGLEARVWVALAREERERLGRPPRS